jgi:hypothetical protein
VLLMAVMVVVIQAMVIAAMVKAHSILVPLVVHLNGILVLPLQDGEDLLNLLLLLPPTMVDGVNPLLSNPLLLPLPTVGAHLLLHQHLLPHLLNNNPLLLPLLTDGVVLLQTLLLLEVGVMLPPLPLVLAGTKDRCVCDG